MPYLVADPSYELEVWDFDEYNYIRAVMFTITQDLLTVRANYDLYLAGGIAAVPQSEKDAILSCMLDSYAAAMTAGTVSPPPPPQGDQPEPTP